MIKSIKKTVSEVAENLQKKEEEGIKIKQIWNKTVNSLIAKNAQPVKYKNKTLTIQTSTPSWKQELLLIKTQIIEKINKKKLTTKIKDIKIL